MIYDAARHFMSCGDAMLNVNFPKDRESKALSFSSYLCTLLLSQQTHELVKHAAIENNTTYDSIVYESLKHHLNCAAKFEELD